MCLRNTLIRWNANRWSLGIVAFRYWHTHHLLQVEVWMQTFAPNSGTPVHRHECEEVFITMKGYGTLYLSRNHDLDIPGKPEEFSIYPNATFTIPVNAVHQVIQLCLFFHQGLWEIESDLGNRSLSRCMRYWRVLYNCGMVGLTRNFYQLINWISECQVDWGSSFIHKFLELWYFMWNL